MSQTEKQRLQERAIDLGVCLRGDVFDSLVERCDFYYIVSLTDYILDRISFLKMKENEKYGKTEGSMERDRGSVGQNKPRSSACLH